MPVGGRGVSNFAYTSQGTASGVYGEWSETKQPQPYPSWTWADGEGWTPPVPYPDDGGEYRWDEGSGEWVAINAEPALLNINSATKAKLETLSRVGPAMAQAIIDGRPWAATSDLSSISGISQTMVDGWDITV
jgi:hypothetical protein